MAHPDTQPHAKGEAPRVSVIVAVLNAAPTLRRCIDSVLGQTDPDVEMILVDGGSTDGSVEILESYGPAISWYRQHGTGIYDAWNLALDHARGAWFCFFGADDYFWDKDVLTQVEPQLRAALDQGIRVVYGKVAVVDAAERVLRVDGCAWEAAKPRFSRELSIPHAGTFHHRSLFDRHGHFDSTMRICGDYDFLLRELPRHDARFMPDIITLGFQHGGISNSPRALRQSFHELRRIRKAHGLPRSPKTWMSRIYMKMFVGMCAVTILGERRVDRIRAYRQRPARHRGGDGR